ncbi:hypothetical protein G9A89_005496 [Geosiphon pyriformis]|nr:hypothetical protein G9A89_005496 [Geosiphon pyriformis]
MSRKRAESLKNASLPLPTASRPQPEDASLLNYKDSGMLLLSLIQSRQAWTSSTFKKFSYRHDIEFKPKLPEDTNPNPTITSLGKCNITIGPHTFYDTRLLEVIYEREESLIPLSSKIAFPKQASVQSHQSRPQQSIRPQPQPIAPQIPLPPPPQVVIQSQVMLQPQVVIHQTPLPQNLSTVRPSSMNRVLAAAPIPASSTSNLSSRSVAPAPTTESNSPPNEIANRTSIPASTQIQNSTSVSATNNSYTTPGNPTTSTPQLTAFMQTVLQSVNPTQILALQALLRQQQSGIPLSLEQRNALLQQLTALHQLLSSSQQIQPQINPPATQPNQINQTTQSIIPPILPSPLVAAIPTPRISPTQTSTVPIPNIARALPSAQISRSATTPVLSSKTQRQFVRHDVIIEFRENKYDRWLFPKDAILEATTATPPYEVLASFYLPQNEENFLGPRQKYQAVTMELSHVSQPIWDALRRSTNDLTLAYQSMVPKTAHNPPREYLQYRLPCDYPPEFLELIAQRVAKLDGTLQIETVQPSVSREKKRKAEKDKERDESKEKEVDKEEETKNKVKEKEKGKGKGKEKDKDIEVEELISDEPEQQKPAKKARTMPKNTEANPKTSGNTRASSSATPKKSKLTQETSATTESTNPPSATSGANKRCAYCSCKSTPMWRRGPDGAGTLCNACGVKWKQGKILSGANPASVKPRVVSRTNNEATDTTATPTVNPKGKRKLSLASATITTPSLRKKTARSLSLSEEGTFSVTDEDDGLEKIQSTTASKVAVIPQKGRRTSTTSKKAANSQVETISQPSTTPLSILGGDLAESPDATSPEKLSPSRLPQDTATLGVSSSNLRPHTAAQTTSSSEYPISLKLTSIAFGPNNATFVQPNCSVALFENYIKIRLARDGYERTSIDIWKESIEDIEFMTDQETVASTPFLTIKVLIGQYLTRFDQELLNPDRNETLVILKCSNAASTTDSGVEKESKDLKLLIQKWLQQS